jgi:hypothetical protein
MKELIIYEFQLEEIKEALRMVSNVLGCNSKETCLDRTVCKARAFTELVLTGQNTEENMRKVSVS